MLTDAQKETVSRIPQLQAIRQVREFRGSAGFCRLRIPGFAEIARPLYEATRHQQNFEWTGAINRDFNDLAVRPALGLPDLAKPFYLYVDEKDGVAKGVLAQYVGPRKRPIADLSKKLDMVAAGWPPCLKIIAAVATMAKDADKLAMGQELHVTTPHAIKGELK